MNKIIQVILKILKKTRLLTLIKIVIPVKFNNLNALIPINSGIGYPNIFTKKDTLWIIYESLYNPLNGVFIDVGTNIGQTLLKLKSINKDIVYVGFEPNKICYNYLLNLININRFEYCHLENVALSDKRQELLLSMNEETDASASLVANLRPNYFNDSVLINSIPFDDFDHNLQIAFIKIDVEGAELEVLVGMEKTIEKFRPIIVCEVLDSFSEEVFAFTQGRAKKLSNFLEKMNYSIVQFEQNHQHDAIISLNEIKNIKLKQWTVDSYRFNDYLFVPNERKDFVFKTIFGKLGGEAS